MQPRQNIQTKLESPLLSLRLALASPSIESSWTLSLRPFLRRAIAICLLQEHLLGVHKGHSEQLNPSGKAGSAVRLCPRADERLWQAVDLASREPGERGGRLVPAVFSHYDCLCSAHVNCLFASGLSTQANSKHGCLWAPQGGPAAQGRCSGRWPALPKEAPSAHPCTHTPGFCSACRKDPSRKKKMKAELQGDTANPTRYISVINPPYLPYGLFKLQCLWLFTCKVMKLAAV